MSQTFILQNFTSRQSISNTNAYTVSIFNCYFRSISNSGLNGGALYLGGNLLLVMKMVFAISCTANYGGFVYCASQRFNLTYCCGDRCIANELGQFGFLIPSGASLNHFNMSSVQRSSPLRQGKYYPIAFRSSENIIHNFNSSYNILDQWGSGLNALGAVSVTVQYSTFSQLFGLCVILFRDITKPAYFSYCNVVDNYIYQSDRYPGVINFCLSMTVSDCVLYNNTNNLFLCDEKSTNTINVLRSYIESSAGSLATIVNPTLFPVSTFPNNHVMNQNCDFKAAITYDIKKSPMIITLSHILYL